jgi:chaperonin GroEL
MKQLHFDNDARNRLISGIEKISKAVKSTLGPRGNTVLIESPSHTHGITVTKDGVTVAKAVDLSDKVENLAVRMMKEAADRTASLAGDGTTTAIVLTEALVMSGVKHLTPDINRTETLRELVSETNAIIDKLSEMSTPVDDRKLLDVAVISANNDPAIGSLIAEVYQKLGKDGIVTVEKSQSSETYVETTDGIKVERGYSSHLFINNHKKDECILEDVYVLVCDSEVSNILAIENVLRPIINEGKKLLVIAPCSNNVINTFAANVLKNNLKLCVIQPPSFGYKQHELMSDIAIAVGAKYYSEKTGDDLSLISVADLGHAAKVIVGRSETIIIKDDETKEGVDERVAQLWEAHAIADKKADKDFIKSRIASLTGGIGVIYVGGNTDLEQKELYDRVDDAVCAVRSAMIEGVLPGAGTALMWIANQYTGRERAVDKIIAEALRAPAAQILANAGIPFESIYPSDSLHPFGWGYDLKGEQHGELMALGVIDPMKVTKSALQNAVSVAVTILSTNAIITNEA